jgi:hypothetical protein
MTRQPTDGIFREDSRLTSPRRAQRHQRVRPRHVRAPVATLKVDVDKFRSEASQAIRKGDLESEERQALAALLVSLAALLEDDAFP